MPKPSIEDIVATLVRGEGKRFELERDPLSGMVTKLKTDGTVADNAAALEAMKIVFAVPLPQFTPNAGAPVAAPIAPPLPAKATPPGVKPVAAGEAARLYLRTLAQPVPLKTISQKAAAVNGFVKSVGLKTMLHDAMRTDVAQWLDSVRMAGLTTSTLENKAAYLKAFFLWAQGAGYYPQGDNPAARQIQRGKNEKRHRRKFGFRALEPDQLATLYAPSALMGLNEQSRWGALIGLYTGARVSEIGQLALSDFREEEGVWSVSITDDGLGQSVKNEASRRIIPVHPDLITLGLRTRVEVLQAAGKKQLFPRAKAGSVNGMGNWLSKAYSRHLQECGVSIDVGKLGFHSLRKTVIQSLKDGGVREEARKEYVGHEQEGEHHSTYGKLFSPFKLLNGVGTGEHQTEGIRVLSYGLDLDATRAALEAPPPKRAKRVFRRVRGIHPAANRDPS